LTVAAKVPLVAFILTVWSRRPVHCSMRQREEFCNGLVAHPASMTIAAAAKIRIPQAYNTNGYGDNIGDKFVCVRVE
ncbi:MAG: hypothetical protein K8R60_04950, partial [Burkholderiales bacterium]|nr:hypothetical protein [Burkholderiales bacterium]